MLELPDGTCYNQSKAIYFLVARRTGLYPTDTEQAYLVDSIVEHVADAKDLPYSALDGALSKKDMLEDGIPKHIGNLERLLGSKQYFLGETSPERCSHSDVTLYILYR